MAFANSDHASSTISNRIVESDLRTVRELGVQIQQTTGLWKKSDIEKRTADLVEVVLGRWPLWSDA